MQPLNTSAASGVSSFAPEYRDSIQTGQPCPAYVKGGLVEGPDDYKPLRKRASSGSIDVETKLPRKTDPFVSPGSDAQASHPTPLTRDFFDDCQALVRRFFHKPLSGQVTTAGAIPRMAHGAMHLSRSACWIPVLLEWRRQAGDPDAIRFAPEMLPVVMKAALLHDSGREGEEADQPEWERRSGENCEDHLLNTGVSPELASACKNAIIHKNRTEETGERRTLLIEKLLHDADCLEIMRCQGHFDIAYLDIYKDYSSQPGMLEKIVSLATDVRDVIHQQSDMLYGVAIIDSVSGTTLAPACPDNYSRSGKAGHEFADNALSHQVNWLKGHSPGLYSLFQAAAEATRGCQAAVSSPGEAYEEVKGLPPQTARHRVLMAKLAQLMGFNTPELKQVDQDYYHCVLKIPAATMTSPVTRDNLPRAERARLFLVASLLGLWDIDDTARLDDNGQLTLTGFSCAGLFHDQCPKTDNQFGATPFELEWLRTPEQERDAFPPCDDKVMGLFKDASSLFADLTDADIGQALAALGQNIGPSIDNLVERLGPDQPMDRYTLRRNLHQRLAFLFRRFPVAADKSRTNAKAPRLQVLPCEQMAINASGISGYCLPVAYRDIEKGELRLYQMIDQGNRPVTEAWLRLTPEATRRLAKRHGVPSPWRRRFEILNFYINQLFNPYNRKRRMNASLRAELQQLLGQCHDWRQELNAETCPIADQDFTTRAQDALEATARILAGLLERQDGEVLSAKPIKFPDSFPAGPSGTLAEKHEDSQFNVKGHRHGRAWESQEWQRIGQNDNVGARNNPNPPENASVHHYRLPSEGWLDGRVEADLFADDLDEAFSFVGILRLRTPGADQESSQRLVDHLAGRGIDVHRASCAEHQNHYLREVAKACQFGPELESLAGKPGMAATDRSLDEFPLDTLSLSDTGQQHSQRVCQKLGLTTPPRWQDYCQQLNGRALYYRPSSSTDRAAETAGVRLVHIFNNQSFLQRGISSYVNPETEAASLELLPRLMHCGHVLDSFVERVRKGISSPAFFWKTRDIRSGGASQTHFTAQQAPNRDNHSGFIAKPLAMRRTDANPYYNDVCHFGNTHPEYARHINQPFNCPLPNDDKNETGLDDFSLEEVETLTVSPKKMLAGFSAVEHLASCWPDGLPLENRLPFRNLEEQFQDLTLDPGPLKRGMGALLRNAGLDQFTRIKTLNPGFGSGHINCLDGIRLTGQEAIQCLDFKGTSVNQANFSGTSFEFCTFKDMDFSQACLDNCVFINCTFDNTTLPPEQLNRTSHQLQSANDAEFQSIRQLAGQLLDWHRRHNHTIVETVDSLCRTRLLKYADLTDDEWQRFFQEVDMETFPHWGNNSMILKMVETGNAKYYPEQHQSLLIDCLISNGHICATQKETLEALAPGQLSWLLAQNPSYKDPCSQYLTDFNGIKFREGITLTGKTPDINLAGAGLGGVHFQGFNLSRSQLSWPQIRQARFSGYSFAQPHPLRPALEVANDYLRNEPGDSLQEKLASLQRTGLLDYLELTEEEFQQARDCGYLPLRSALMPGFIDRVTDAEVTQLQGELCSGRSPCPLNGAGKGLVQALSDARSVRALCQQNPHLDKGEITSLTNCVFGRSGSVTYISPEHEQDKLCGINFSGSVFTQCDFGSLDIINCRFRNCVFDSGSLGGDCEIILMGNDFSRSRFSSCVINNTRFYNIFHSAIFDACDFQDTDFSRCNLTNASFRRCQPDWMNQALNFLSDIRQEPS